ncbi:MAG: efflux RND transporter periplasmic adaptor subunit [Bryobacteraceae bacterium]|nr:efflux RND transporter periplasmic adaptor subunit [Bryobacteraceae bacterium]
MRKRAWILLLAALALALAFWLRRQESPSDVIRFSGNIELTEVHISFKIPGRLVERLVDEGRPVRKGMVVARLDRDQLLSQRAREQAGLAAAQSALAQLLTAIELQRETLEAETAARRADLEQAEARLRELEAGARPQEIQEARAAAAAARAEQERARNDWERAQVLFRNDDISAAQHDQFRTAYERAAAALRQAELRLSLIEEGPRKETLEQARAQAARARAALRLAEAGRIELRRRQQEVALRRADIARAHAQLGLIEAQLRDTEALSPVDGVVLVTSAEPGETVAAGTTVLTIGDLERPWLRGYIGERDLGRVKLGQRVRVTTDSYPGKVYWGRVSFIAAQAEFTPKEIQTPEERVKLVYRIKVDLPNPRHELKSNMPADAEILVE